MSDYIREGYKKKTFFFWKYAKRGGSGMGHMRAGGGAFYKNFPKDR